MAAKAPAPCAVVVAHPDDETLFFGGAINYHRDIDWHVVCVTDGRDGGDPTSRLRELRHACGRLGVARLTELGLEDSNRRPLPVDSLVPRLTEVVTESRVLTHNVMDVHPHHRQVLLACCLAFGVDRVSMFTPRYPLDSKALRAKRAVLRDAYPSQFRTEELLRHYPWWCEGVEHPSFVVLDSVPFESPLLPESVWNISLEAELVTRPQRVLVAVEAARLQAMRGSIAATQDRNRVIDFLIRSAAERAMRAGKTHHMAWFSGVRAIMDRVGRLGRLQTFDFGDRQCSAWIASQSGLYKIPGLTPMETDAGSIEYLGTVGRAALDLGISTLWLPPDDTMVELLEKFDRSMIRLESPSRHPRASAADLWEELRQ